MGRPSIDVKGKRYGNLLVTDRAYSKGKYLYWQCKCDCGNETFVTSSDLTRLHTTSCGKCQDKIDLSPYKCLYGNYKRGAKKRNLSFNLTLEQFIEISSQNCNYCGSEPNQTLSKPEMRGTAIYNGIDRVDNNIGYETDNVVPCCKFCNFAKSKSTIEEFEAWIERIVNHRLSQIIKEESL